MIGWNRTCRLPVSIAWRRSVSRSRRASTLRCIWASNTAWRALPPALARYIATSASRISSSGSTSGPPSAIPIEPDRNSSRPAISNGSASVVSTRSATTVASRGSVGVLEQHGELVAAHARDGVAGAQRGVEAERDRLQQLVAGVVAERVVDHLEAVEVEEEHRGARAGPAAACSPQRLLQPVEEQRAVRQPRERVVQRAVLQPLDRAAVVGGVADGALERVGVERRPWAGGRPRRRRGRRGRRRRRWDRRAGSPARRDPPPAARAPWPRAASAASSSTASCGCSATAASADASLVTQWTSARAVGQQPADVAAVGLVGGDEEQDERRLGHGPGSDGTSRLKTEQ